MARPVQWQVTTEAGGVPEWPKGTDCKSVGVAFEGSNPSPTTIILFFAPDANSDISSQDRDH